MKKFLIIIRNIAAFTLVFLFFLALFLLIAFKAIDLRMEYDRLTTVTNFYEKHNQEEDIYFTAEKTKAQKEERKKR